MPQNFLRKFVLSTVIGTGIGILSSAVLIFLMAAAITAIDFPVAMLSPVTVFFLAFGGFFGGFASAKIFGEKGIFCGFISGLLFFIVAWLSGVVFETSGFGTAVIFKFTMIAVAGSLGGIIGVNYIKRK